VRVTLRYHDMLIYVDVDCLRSLRDDTIMIRSTLPTIRPPVIIKITDHTLDYFMQRHDIEREISLRVMPLLHERRVLRYAILRDIIYVKMIRYVTQLLLR